MFDVQIAVLQSSTKRVQTRQTDRSTRQIGSVADSVFSAASADCRRSAGRACRPSDLPGQQSAASLGTSRLSRLNFLLFSPSGVLYDDTLWWRWMLQMLSRFGLHTHPRVLTALWRQDYFEDICCGRRDFFEALREFLTACGLHSGQIDELYAAGRPRWRRLELELRAFPQAAPCLSHLARQGWRLGLSVHSPLALDEARMQLRRMRIGEHFQNVVCSQELACRRSHVDFWPSVLSRFSVSADEVGLVSHEAGELAAARRAGLTTLAYQCSAAVPADAHLGHLGEVCALASSIGMPLQQAA